MTVLFICLQRWFDFMGSISNGYAPFQINYVYHKSTILRPRSRNNERKTPYGPFVQTCDKEARPGLGTQNSLFHSRQLFLYFCQNTYQTMNFINLIFIKRYMFVYGLRIGLLNSRLSLETQCQVTRSKFKLHHLVKH